MKRTRFFQYCATFTALVLAGFVINADPAIAQQVNDDQTREVIEEIVKLEALIERRQVGHRSALGTWTEIIELRRQVSFADLDLSKVADVTELERRIEDTAKESCEQLAEMYPIPRSNSIDIRLCTKKAIESTSDELETVIAAAE